MVSGFTTQKIVAKEGKETQKFISLDKDFWLTQSYVS
jgi:hypothetical protein